MKKIFLIFALTGMFANSLNSMTAEKANTSENIDTKISDQLTALNAQMEKIETLISQSGVSKNSSQIKKTDSRISHIKEKVKNLFNFVSANIEKILTTKGAITTLLIIGQLFTAYCIFFTPEPVKALIAKITSWSTKGAVDVGASMGEGIIEGATEGIKDNWWEVAKIGGFASLGFTLIQIPTVIITTAAPILIKLLLLKAHVPLDKLK